MPNITSKSFTFDTDLAVDAIAILKSFIADGASLQFYNGTTASNGDEFVTIIEKQYQDGLAEGNSGEWVFRYAFSIKPSKPEGTDHPNNRGEWVNAGFAGSV